MIMGDMNYSLTMTLILLILLLLSHMCRNLLKILLQGSHLVLFRPRAQESEQILPPKRQQDPLRDQRRQLLDLAWSPLAWRLRIRQHHLRLDRVPHLLLRARLRRLLLPMPRPDLLWRLLLLPSRPQDRLWPAVVTCPPLQIPLDCLRLILL
jgi:hypothetical protein